MSKRIKFNVRNIQDVANGFQNISELLARNEPFACSALSRFVPPKPPILFRDLDSKKFQNLDVYRKNALDSKLLAFLGPAFDGQPATALATKAATVKWLESVPYGVAPGPEALGGPTYHFYYDVPKPQCPPANPKPCPPKEIKCPPVKKGPICPPTKDPCSTPSDSQKQCILSNICPLVADKCGGKKKKRSKNPCAPSCPPCPPKPDPCACPPPEPKPDPCACPKPKPKPNPCACPKPKPKPNPCAKKPKKSCAPKLPPCPPKPPPCPPKPPSCPSPTCCPSPGCCKPKGIPMPPKRCFHTSDIAFDANPCKSGGGSKKESSGGGKREKVKCPPKGSGGGEGKKGGGGPSKPKITCKPKGGGSKGGGGGGKKTNPCKPKGGGSKGGGGGSKSSVCQPGHKRGTLKPGDPIPGAKRGNPCKK